MSNTLHLPDLTIKGFRGIDDLTIPRLGRVTLLAGKNGVGKTTVLEAVSVFAARGRLLALIDVLTNRGEVELVTDDDHNWWLGNIDYASLFYGPISSERKSISIGSKEEQLRIEMISLEEEVPSLLSFVDSVQGLSVRFRDTRQVRWDFSEESLRLFQRYQPFPPNDKPEPEITRERLGPGTPSERDIARLWDTVVLTRDEERAVQALRLIIDRDVLDVAVIGDGEPSISRRMVVRFEEQDRPVPLRSLGDGAVRLLGVALALVGSRGGFLLIDEAENGIHHTAQYEFWKLVLQMADANDVQVLATTHSWDCVRGFAYAASEHEHGDGVLVRLDRDDRGLRAVEYSKEGLLTAAEQGIEVR